ncbi:MAG: DUF2924 domain-containing protein [Kofleriaceae bacterium]
MNAKTKRTMKRLEEMRLPELQAEYAKVIGESTRTPNRVFLMRRIREALAARPSGLKAVGGKERTPSTKAPSEGKPRGRFASLSIAELQAKYLEVVGRPTGSGDRAYLVWKIREAEKGRVPVGPRKVRVAEEMTTLPFRIPTAAVDEMDAVWRQHGVKSRNRFLQDAVGHYLEYLGASAAAFQFSASAEPA